MSAANGIAQVLLLLSLLVFAVLHPERGNAPECVTDTECEGLRAEDDDGAA